MGASISFLPLVRSLLKVEILSKFNGHNTLCSDTTWSLSDTLTNLPVHFLGACSFMGPLLKRCVSGP